MLKGTRGICCSAQYWLLLVRYSNHETHIPGAQTCVVVVYMSSCVCCHHWLRLVSPSCVLVPSRVLTGTKALFLVFADQRYCCTGGSPIAFSPENRINQNSKRAHHAAQLWTACFKPARATGHMQVAYVVSVVLVCTRCCCQAETRPPPHRVQLYQGRKLCPTNTDAAKLFSKRQQNQARPAYRTPAGSLLQSTLLAAHVDQNG